MNKADVIIVGGGVIGCSIAYRLASENVSVIIIERGQPGEEASSAAAGMIAVQAETAHEPRGPFFDLCLASRALYPSFVAEVEAAAGMSVEYRTDGAIFVAFDFAESEILSAVYEKQKAVGLTVEDLTSSDVRQLEPALADTVQTALYFRDDHHVDNRRLMKALVIAAERKGVRFVCGSQVIGLIREGTRIIGVKTSQETFLCNTVINCAGAWASTIDPTAVFSLLVKPIRGQIVLLESQPPLVRHVLHSADCYLVPRSDGRLLLGSTMENVGYDKRVTAEAVAQLIQSAQKISPAVSRCTFREAWAGLRPDTVDHSPILGQAEDGLVIAAGHFRNGIMLAPITAKLISELVVSGQPSIDLAPFSPGRFA
jgi:glycine oxidase